MSDTSLTVPGDIPGLLRKGSPVVVARGRYIGLGGVVVGLPAGESVSMVLDLPSSVEILSYNWAGVALDLSDPTGRAHAAWWLRVHMRNPAVTAREMGETWQDLLGAIREAERSHDEPDESWIDILRRVVLHVAGRGS